MLRVEGGASNLGARPKSRRADRHGLVERCSCSAIGAHFSCGPALLLAGAGACLLGQKNYPDAERLLRQGYEELRQHEASIPASFRRVRLTESMERLVQLYDATGKPEEAAKWRKQLEDVGKLVAPAKLP